MGKKLSGAQNRKRKAEEVAAKKKGQNSMEKFIKPIDNKPKESFEKSYETFDSELIDSGTYKQKPSLDIEKKEIQTQYDELIFDDDVDVLNESTVCDVSYLENPAEWPLAINIKRNIIDRIVMIGPKKIFENISYPLDEHKRHFSNFHVYRNCENGEKIKRRWLIYSKTSDKVYCFCCKLFKPDSGTSLGNSGCNYWKHIGSILSDHEKSTHHFIATSIWIESETRLKKNACIDAQNQHIYEQESLRWTKVFDRLISIILYLAQQNMAFRGTSDKLFQPNNGNFLGLVQLLGKYDDVMADHLRHISKKSNRKHYCSHEIQDQLINLMANNVRDTIIANLHDAKYYSIITDCTPDISKSEQMSFTVRFIEKVGNSIIIKEHFIGFKTATDSTGLGLSQLMLQTLIDNNIEFTNCRGQGYDNGANMKGKNQGVQARLLNINPRAFYIPCSCHSFNLVVADAASSSKGSISLFGLIQRVYILFSASVNRWEILKRHISRFTVKQVCTTRWESRVSAVKAMRYETNNIVNALIEISDSPNADAGLRHEAQCLADNLCEFEFLISLVVWYDLLFQINVASKAMQGITIDIITATSIVKGCLNYIISYRNTGYIYAVSSAKKIAETLNLETSFKPKRHRITKRQFQYENLDNYEPTPEEEFKRDFFYRLIDTSITSIQSRFEQLEAHKNTWGFLYNISDLPEHDTLVKHCMDLHNTLKNEDQNDINGVYLCVELEHIKTLLPKNISSPKAVLEYMLQSNTSDLFPNTWISLRILLTIPVTVAIGEKSFSKLKLIKTYLRSTLGNEKLTSLAILSIENEIAQRMDFSEIIKNFAKSKARKVFIKV